MKCEKGVSLINAYTPIIAFNCLFRSQTTLQLELHIF